MLVIDRPFAERARRGHLGPRMYQALAALAVLMVLAGLFVVCRELDEREDRRRPMYHDALTMAWAQYAELKAGGAVVPADLSPGERVTVGDRTIVASPGVRVRVVASGAGYCVRGWNQYGESTPSFCGDARRLPPSLGSLADD